MKSKEELIELVKEVNKNQLWFMIHDFELIGFYREDKRVQKKFIIDCINNCYTTQITVLGGHHDEDSLLMEKAVLKAISK